MLLVHVSCGEPADEAGQQAPDNSQPQEAGTVDAGRGDARAGSPAEERPEPRDAVVGDAARDSGGDAGGERFHREAFSGIQGFTHDGLERTYYLHVPLDLPAHAPLVSVMHGYSGSAESTMGYSGVNDLADEHGFAVFYPQGTDDSSGNAFFNVGYQFHQDNGMTVDDLGFIRALTAHLQQAHTLSTEHVFATGMSNGGDMSYLLACQASDIFKAIASVAGTMMQHIHASCAPAKPMPVFEIHGTRDDVTYYDGDMANADGWGAYLDIPAVIEFWVDLNNLDQYSATDLPDTDPSDGSRVVFERYQSETSVNEVWLYRVEEGGHNWPGVWGNRDIDAGQVIWTFFSQYVGASGASE